MKKHYFLAIDEGTTGTTALIVDQDLVPVAISSRDFPQIYPQPGWVEHDLETIWKSVLATIQEVIEKVDASSIVGIGITNQRETVGFWDRKTGQPFMNALVWQDRRSAPLCEALKQKGYEPTVQEKTGLLLDPYFSGSKIHWAIENNPKIKSAQKDGNLQVGTMDSFLVHRLTSGAAHVTEASNASRTLLMNLRTQEYDSDLCDSFHADTRSLPRILNSFGIFGKTKGVPGLPDGIPISGILGDQQSALLGQACVLEGEAKCTYGTGAFILMNSGHKVIHSQHRLLSTVGWKDQAGKVTYALEGSAFIAGAAVQWVRDGLGWIESSSEIEALAASVESTEGVVFVPALTGLGAPYWNPEARGMFAGITRGTQKAHMARAVLEGIAFQISDILVAMTKDLGRSLASVNVDGGASENNLLMQFQADILNVELRRPKFIESTSLGAVFAAGLGLGVWSDLSEIRKVWKEDRRFKPQMAESLRRKKCSDWERIVKLANAAVL